MPAGRERSDPIRAQAAREEARPVIQWCVYKHSLQQARVRPDRLRAWLAYHDIRGLAEAELEIWRAPTNEALAHGRPVGAVPAGEPRHRSRRARRRWADPDRAVCEAPGEPPTGCLDPYRARLVVMTITPFAPRTPYRVVEVASFSTLMCATSAGLSQSNPRPEATKTSIPSTIYRGSPEPERVLPPRIGPRRRRRVCGAPLRPGSGPRADLLREQPDRLSRGSARRKSRGFLRYPLRPGRSRHGRQGWGRRQVWCSRMGGTPPGPRG